MFAKEECLSILTEWQEVGEEGDGKGKVDRKAEGMKIWWIRLYHLIPWDNNMKEHNNISFCLNKKPVNEREEINTPLRQKVQSPQSFNLVLGPESNNGSVDLH